MEKTAVKSYLFPLSTMASTKMIGLNPSCEDTD